MSWALFVLPRAKIRNCHGHFCSLTSKFLIKQKRTCLFPPFVRQKSEVSEFRMNEWPINFSVKKKKSAPNKPVIFLRNFKSPVKVTGFFFFREKFIGHSFIRNPEISLFYRIKGGKREVLFCLPLISLQHSRNSQNLFSKLEFDYVLTFDW